jgi:formyltetrahydrofolate synthetase
VGAQLGAQEDATEVEDLEDELEALVEYQIPPDVRINYVNNDSEDELETIETEKEVETVEKEEEM